MDTIQEQVIEKIATIGAGESLLIFTTDKDTFIKFDAKLNGQIQMTADNGNIEVLKTRDNIAQVIEDFSIIEQIKELPLKTIKLNADGQFQIDDEPDTFLTSTDGIADRSGVPLGQQVKAALLNILPNLSAERLEDIRGDGTLLVYSLENGFSLQVNSYEISNELRISCSSGIVSEKQIEAHIRDYQEKPHPFMVRTFYHENPYSGSSLSFNIELPAIPFIAQHLAFALTKIADAMQDWTTNYGGNIV